MHPTGMLSCLYLFLRDKLSCKISEIRRVRRTETLGDGFITVGDNGVTSTRRMSDLPHISHAIISWGVGQGSRTTVVGPEGLEATPSPQRTKPLDFMRLLEFLGKLVKTAPSSWRILDTPQHNIAINRNVFTPRNVK